MTATENLGCQCQKLLPISLNCQQSSTLPFLRLWFENICQFLIPYCARTYSLFHVATGSFTTATEKLKGRSGCKGITTYPCGHTVVGKPTFSSHPNELEELANVGYLGPVNCHGGGFWGAFADWPKVGLVDENRQRLSGG